jgi:hypothetical protein
MIIKKGTRFKNNYNGHILTVVKDFEVSEGSGRKMVQLYCKFLKSSANLSGVSTMCQNRLFEGFTETKEKPPRTWVWSW